MDNMPLPSQKIKMNIHNFQTVIVTPSIIIPEQRSSEQDSATIKGAPPPDRPKILWPRHVGTPLIVVTVL